MTFLDTQKLLWLRKFMQFPYKSRITSIFCADAILFVMETEVYHFVLCCVSYVNLVKHHGVLVVLWLTICVELNVWIYVYDYQKPRVVLILIRILIHAWLIYNDYIFYCIKSANERDMVSWRISGLKPKSFTTLPMAYFHPCKHDRVLIYTISLSLLYMLISYIFHLRNCSGVPL